LHALGLPGGICIATHAVFAGDAQEQLLAAGAERVHSTDTIVHPSNAIGIGELLVAPVAELFDAMAARADAEPPGQAEAWFEGEQDPG
jgi:ribose-phosphate pyrophosphokinase